MVLEFLENGDLKTFLQKHAKEKTNFDKLLLICEDVSICGKPYAIKIMTPHFGGQSYEKCFQD